MFRALLFAVLVSQVLAWVKVLDPSDYANLKLDAADNAIKANYNVAPVLYQLEDIVGLYYFSDTQETISHETLAVDANDTSVIVVTEGASLNLEYSTVIKDGYGSNLLQQSFFGLNAAINIANASTATISNTNITAHNAANIFAYGDDTVVYVYDSDLYSSGPVSHGLYGAGNGTIYAYNIRHYSGGNRCSSFAGDNPAGYVHVYDSVAHTAGIGSAIFYALGEVWGTNIIGYTERAPILFSDGPQHAYIQDSVLTSDFLAGTVIFCSMVRQEGAYLLLNETLLTVTQKDQPALWFGNVIASADIISSEIVTASGILVLANRSQVTQEFDYFAGYEQNTAILPAEVTLSVSESALTGDIIAYNQSTISWTLGNSSSWAGSAYTMHGGGEIAVSLDASSNWTLTRDTLLQNFTDADTSLKNVYSRGYTLYYEANSTANTWLQGKTYQLNGGGKVKPYY